MQTNKNMKIALSICFILFLFAAFFTCFVAAEGSSGNFVSLFNSSAVSTDSELPSSMPSAPVSSTPYDEFAATDLSFTSSNSNGSMAINGDQVTISFHTTLKATVKKAELAGYALTLTGKDGISWSATDTISGKEGIENGGKICFTIILDDGLGDEITLSQDNAKEIHYYAPLTGKISELSFNSSNSKPNLAKRGNSLNLSYRLDIDESDRLEIKIAGVSIPGNQIRKNGTQWSAAYTLGSDASESLTDNSQISFEVYDKYYQQAIADNQICPILQVDYYAPLSDCFSNVTIDSSNSIKNLAKNGDTVTISFQTAHPVFLTDLEVGGQPVTFKNTDDTYMNWAGSWSVAGDELSDNAPINFSVTLNDEAQNSSAIITENDSANQIVYYAPIENSIKNIKEFSSNAKNDLFAKDGDNVTVHFTSTHPVILKNQNIARQTVTFMNVDHNGMNWEASIVIKDELKLQDNSVIPFGFSASDVAGNTSASKTESNAESAVTFFDSIEKSFSSLTIASTNSKNSNLAKDGDMITIKFKTSHPVQIGSSEIGDSDVTFYSSNGMDWIATHIIKNNEIANQSNVPFGVTVSDQADNAEVRKSQDDITNKIVYYAPIVVSNLTFVSDNAQQHDLVKNGSTVKLSFQTQNEVTLSGVSIAGKTVSPQTRDNKNWTVSYSIQSGDIKMDNSVVSFGFTAEDKAGNTAAKTQQDTACITYFAPIEIVGLSASTNNSRSGYYAKNGDIVSVHFSTTHPVIISNFSVAGKNGSCTSMNNKGMDWTGTYQIENGDLPDNSQIYFSITANDNAQNTPVSKSQNDVVDGKSILYFAPIESSVENFEFKSENKNAGYAKVGDSINISFQTTHPVILSNVNIAGKSIVPQNTGSTKWNIAYTMEKDQIPDNTNVKFNLAIDDLAGNSEVTKTDHDVSKITYQAPIVIHDLTFESNNAKSKYLARNGNILTVQFHTTHPVQLASSKVADRFISFQSYLNNGMDWSATYQVNNGETKDFEDISLFFDANDAAGNAQVSVTQNNVPQIKYYAPISITDLKIISNNGKDSLKYAKNGDTIQVSFQTNHPMLLTDASIAFHGVMPVQTVCENPVCQYEYAYTLKPGDMTDLADVPFHFQADDAAGNDTAHETFLSSNVNGRIQYFAPITAGTSIDSTGNNKQFAKNGDAVQLIIKANHDVSVNNPVVSGRAASSEGDKSTALKVEYRIPENETSLREGNVAFSYNLIDPAGNTLPVHAVSDQSKVVYDRTRPLVDLRPDFSGFLNEGINYVVTYSDANLSSNGIEMVINNSEQTLPPSVSHNSGISVFTKSAALNAEGVYNIIGKAQDLAGNESQPEAIARITIDKTSPTITSTKIQLAKTLTFKKGFRIADYFNINEKYIKDIICKLSDSFGSVDWDINEPINTDGKKTIYLLVTDMSGNHSQALTYDFYIDGTAPKMHIKDLNTDEDLTAGNNPNIFTSSISLEAYLEKLEIGNETRDKFTTLQLLNQNGCVIDDLLKNAENSDYKAKITTYGTYRLIARAVDSVGNETESQYGIIYRDKTNLERLMENKPLFYSFAVIASALIAVLVFLIKKAVDFQRAKMSPKSR